MSTFLASQSAPPHQTGAITPVTLETFTTSVCSARLLSPNRRCPCGVPTSNCWDDRNCDGTPFAKSPYEMSAACGAALIVNGAPCWAIEFWATPPGTKWTAPAAELPKFCETTVPFCSDVRFPEFQAVRTSSIEPLKSPAAGSPARAFRGATWNCCAGFSAFEFSTNCEAAWLAPWVKICEPAACRPAGDTGGMVILPCALLLIVAR